MTQKISAFILLFSISTITVFGIATLAGMAHGGGHACPVSLLAGGDYCPPSQPGFLPHHLSEFESLTRAILSVSLMLLIAIAFFVGNGVLRLLRDTGYSLFSPLRAFLDEVLALARKPLFAWISLHKKQRLFSGA